MWHYSDKVLDHFYHPRNQGVIADQGEPGVAVVRGEVGSLACGDALHLYLKIDRASDRILAATFQTFGCTSAIAASSALTEMVKGRTVDEALAITNQDIADYLDGLPPQKMHCSVMGQEALEQAIAKYRGWPIAKPTADDSPLVCTCFGVSADRIRKVVQENRLTTVEEVTHYTKAGGGCGTCRDAIADILARTVAPPRLTTLQKIQRIQAVLAEVRPLLRQEGGDVELVDLEGNRVWVQLQGACGDCPSRLTTVKGLIEVRLQQVLGPALVVEALS